MQGISNNPEKIIMCDELPFISPIDINLCNSQILHELFPIKMTSLTYVKKNGNVDVRTGPWTGVTKK